MDEVVGDVDAFERASDGGRVGDVGGDRAHALAFGRVTAARYGEHLALLRKLRDESAADEPGRAQDGDPHGCSPAAKRLK